MNRSSRLQHFLALVLSGIKRYRMLLLVLSAVVVFVVSYLLVLPALTLEKDEAAEQGGISLETGSAQTYAAGELSYDGKAYDVKASYQKEAELPAETELQVKEITRIHDEYDRYYQKAMEAVQMDTGEQEVSDFSFAQFYDITLKTDNCEVEPADTVHVSISYNRIIPVENANHIRIIHFKENT